MRRRYGPHDPATSPDAITVGRPGAYQGSEVVPLHPALIRQRQVISDHAHQEVADHD